MTGTTGDKPREKNVERLGDAILFMAIAATVALVVAVGWELYG